MWDAEDTGIADRLSYIIGLLLAVSAFQISIAEGLPYKSQFTLIDQYFLWAYLIMVGMVIEQSLEQSIRVFGIYDGEEKWVKIFVGGGLVLLWIIQSFTFVLKYIAATDGICKPIFHFNFCNCRNWCGLLYYISCGLGNCLESCIDCCIVKSRCRLCLNKKRYDRLSTWMDMEKSESSSWDTTKQLKILSKKAEMVLGTQVDQARYYTMNGWNDTFEEYRGNIMTSLKQRDEQQKKGEKSKFMIKNWCCCKSKDNCCYKNAMQHQDTPKKNRAMNEDIEMDEDIVLDDDRTGNNNMKYQTVSSHEN